LASDTRADVRDIAAVTRAFERTQPDVIFHLAAQPLVRQGYRDPRETFETNVMGTVNVLDSARHVQATRAIVVITTDKVYANQGDRTSRQESDPLGGVDPYSGSKASAELAVASLRESYFSSRSGFHARVSTARAGNVIGGGDWAADRLIPDCLRAFERGEPVKLRFPNAVRPWQHVLEPLSGYLLLAQKLSSDGGEEFACPWNFGPNSSRDGTVKRVAELAASFWGPGATIELAPDSSGPHEDEWLQLDTRQARSKLGWQPRWTLPVALDKAVSWHRAWFDGADMLGVTRSQIADYVRSETT
jgi:CDP-glucose 4,6-dehydratase